MSPILSRLFFLAPVLIAIFAVGVAGAGEKPKVKDTLSARHFPMKVGHKWVYDYAGKDVTFEVLGTEKTRGTTVFVVRRTIGKTEVDFKVAVEEDAVYIYQEGKKEFAPPLRQFAFFPKPGDAWKWRGTYGGKLRTTRFEHLGVDEVTVRAGTYSAIMIHQTEENGDWVTFWLAEGVGIVQLTGKPELLEGANIGFEWKLKSFHGK